MKDKLIRLSDALQVVRESYIWDSEISQRTLEKKLAALPGANVSKYLQRLRLLVCSSGIANEDRTQMLTALSWIEKSFEGELPDER